MGPAKLEKAAKLNIPMLTETDFMKLVNENLKKKMWAFLKETNLKKG
jgi:BRCT domain type II-containing protein